MRFRHILPAACLVVTPALAHPPADISWGKSNVSLEQFAADANECDDTSRTVAVSIKPETLKELDALSSAQLLDMAMDLQSVSGGPASGIKPTTAATSMSSTKSEADIARRSNTFGSRFEASSAVDVSSELQAVLDKCLADRGYVRIRLTGDQMKTLSRLKRRSAERTAYLHSIDSDPAVIARQRLASGA